MKKIISIILCLVLLLGVLAGCQPNDTAKETLRIYNWEDYIDPELLDAFTEFYNEKYNTDLTVLYETFDTNETMYTKIEKAKENYDLVCPSDYIIEKMVKQGLVIPMDKNIVGASYDEYVPDFIKMQYSEITGNTEDTLYSVGYTWGTMGIMYNKEHVDFEDLETQGWEILWNEKYAGKIYMKDSIRDTVGVANIYVYKEEYESLKNQLDIGEISLDEYIAAIQEVFNRTDEDTIAKMEEALKDQKATVDAMYDIDNDKNAMVNGTAYLDVCWSGDAVWAIIETIEAESDVELGYYIPEVATNLFFDGWVIPKYATNQTAANEFVNFLLQPENAITVMDYIGYTSVVSSPEVLEYAASAAFEEHTESDVSYFFEGEDNVIVNSSMYPPKSTIYSTAIMRDYGENAENITWMWSKIKGNTLSVFAIIINCLVFAILIFAFVRHFLSKRKKKVVRDAVHREYRPD